MIEIDKWEKLRQIVREELEARFPRKTKTQSKPRIVLNGKGFEGISEEQTAAWKAAYPMADIGQCLSMAWAWCVSNPEKAPKSNYGRFLNSWIRKEQNEAARQAIPKAKAWKLKCKSCGAANWSSLSSGKCQNCR